MKGRFILAITAVGALLFTEAVEAQPAGAIEVGATGRFSVYDSEVGVENALAGGGRLGFFFMRNVSLEVEATYSEPELTDQPGWQGRTFISHELYQGRLLFSHWMSERVALLVGAGVAYDHYFRPRVVGIRGAGVGGLLGFRYALSDRFSGRVEAMAYYINEDDDGFPAPRPTTLNMGLQAGLSYILRDREVVREVQLPAPPPDTITVTREVEPALPQGTATQLCLATGETVTVYVTPQGDTLVGPRRVSVRQLGPGVAFAGEYAEGRSWFTNDEPVLFQERSYQQAGGQVSMNCANLMRVGEFGGVPLFADTGATSPYARLYVPVRPGVWQAYETNLAAVRGS